MAEIERMAALCLKDIDDEEIGDEDLEDEDRSAGNVLLWRIVFNIGL